MEYHENLGKLVSPINGRKHGFVECTARPISTIEVINDIIVSRRQESIALAITQEALRLNLNPFKVRTVRQGDKILIVI